MFREIILSIILLLICGFWFSELITFSFIALVSRKLKSGVVR